jgi:hypothetical protein
MSSAKPKQDDAWAPYPDVARSVYGWRLWKQPMMRQRLLAHWLEERHPYRERFLAQREMIDGILSAEEPPATLDRRLRDRGTSLRAAAREIPLAFGSFFE